jgi:hypothetical protein
VIPAAQQQATAGAEHVGEDVDGVEFAVAEQEGLEDFGSDRQAGCDGEEGEVDDAAAGEFQDPVEGELEGVRAG